MGNLEIFNIDLVKSNNPFLALINEKLAHIKDMEYQMRRAADNTTIIFTNRIHENTKETLKK